MFKFLRKHFLHYVKNDEQFVEEKAESLNPKALFELYLYSTFVFVLTALLLQFLISLQTALLIQSFSISFTYSLFDISFSSVNADLWPEERILFVYGLGMLVFFGLGLLLMLLLKRRRHINWKLRLALTWMAFLMVNSIPIGMLSGLFIFDGFGIAYTWLFDSVIVKVLLALLALQIAMYYRPFWVNLFFKTAYSASLLSGSKNRKNFIKTTFIHPWASGVIILLAFVMPHFAWSWLVFILGLGFIVLPVFRNKISKRRYLVDKYSKGIFRFPYPIVRFFILLAVLWLADFYSKTSF